MADKRIQDLTPASSVQTNDLFVLEQNGAAKSLTGQVLVNDLATYLDGHGGIANIVYAPPVAPSLNGTMTIITADETEYTLTVTNGNGITGITWQAFGTPGDGQTHTGTIHYTNGTTSQVVINDGLRGYTGAQTYVWFKWAQDYPTQDSDMQNNAGPYIGIYSGTSSTAPATYTSYVWYQYKGAKGDTGSAVESIEKTSTSGLVDTYTVYITGHVAIDTFTVTNGKGIVSFVQTSGTHAAGTSDTYTITYNDGDTATISVYNGANGLGSVSTVSGIQADGNGDVPQVVSGNGAPTTATVGQENQLYYDLNSGGLYYCAGESQGTYIWFAASSQVPVDSALSSSSTNPVQNKVITAKVGTTALNTTATDLSGAVNEVLAGIPAPQTSGTPANLGTAARGSALTYSRSDHVHNKPTYTKSDVGLGNLDNVQQYSASNPPPYPVISVNNQTGAAVLPYGTQSDITDGTHDLNDYKTAGVYYFSTGANLSNAPNSALDGWLTVYQSSQDGACKQVWQREGSNPKNFKDFYMRLYYESAWGDWFAITDGNGVIRYKDFSFGISFSGGTAGTYAGTKDFDISLSGWTPIGICMYKAPSAGTILCYPMINISSNNARLAYGRWGTGAYNETVTVRVAYVKG